MFIIITNTKYNKFVVQSKIRCNVKTLLGGIVWDWKNFPLKKR